MTLENLQPTVPLLSICITTLNRAAFIGATLESILSQLTAECEIVVLDGASTDGTEQVVSEYARRFDRLRYFRQETNCGFDRDCNRVVELARGEYCWLMTDDDLMKPGAVARVLKALERAPSLVIANFDVASFNMSKILQRTSLRFDSDRTYAHGEMDRLFTEVDECLMFVGCVVIRRAIWLMREKDRYFGSMFIHVAVIFQEVLPGETLVIAEPLVSYRMGNTHSYSQTMLEILFVKWPSLFGTFVLSRSAIKKIRSAEPWRSAQWLLLLRGWGYYSLAEYRRWVRPRLPAVHERLLPFCIAATPGSLVNALLVVYYSVHPCRGRWLEAMRHSRFHPQYRRTHRVRGAARVSEG